MREKVRNSFKIGGAFVGLLVGGGFASGQEIFYYFTSYGWYGLFGAMLAALIFAFLGMTITSLGYQLKTTSHKEVVLHIAGPVLGSVIDCLITVFSFCFTVAMFAGASSAFEHLFGIDGFVGSLLLMLLTAFTLMLNVRSIINVIALLTPYLLAVFLIISLFSIMNMDMSFVHNEQLAKQQHPPGSHWVLGAIRYVSYNLAIALPMLAVMGSTVKTRKEASWGGIIGGLLLGVLIILVFFALLAKMDVIYGKSLPTLIIAMDIHPFVGILMATILIIMLYSTAIGVQYAFVVRFVPQKSRWYKPFVVLTGLIAFFASFIGFTTIVNTVYAIMGYLGFIVVIVLLWTWMKKKIHPLT